MIDLLYPAASTQLKSMIKLSIIPFQYFVEFDLSVQFLFFLFSSIDQISISYLVYFLQEGRYRYITEQTSLLRCDVEFLRPISRDGNNQSRLRGYLVQINRARQLFVGKRFPLWVDSKISQTVDAKNKFRQHQEPEKVSDSLVFPSRTPGCRYFHTWIPNLMLIIAQLWSF